MANNCSIKQLRAFVAVATTRNFTLAAERLFITQSTLTSNMQQFEAELGVRLFDRTTRKVTLTSAGVAFLPAASRLLQDFETAIADVKMIGAGQTGRVCVATAASVMAHVLAPCVSNFTQSFPHIHLTIRDAISSEIQARVSSGEVDIGFTTPISSESDLLFTPFVADRMGVICRPGHALVQRSRPLDWDQLQPYSYVSLTSDTGTGALLNSELSSLTGRLSMSHEVSTVNMLYWLLMGNENFSIVPALVAALPALRGLEFRLLSNPQIERQTGILRARNREPSAAVQRFVQGIEISLQTISLPDGVRLLRQDDLLG